MKIKKVVAQAKKKPALLVALSVCVLLAAYVLTLLLLNLTYYRNRTLPNLYVSSIEAGNLSYEEVGNLATSELTNLQISFSLNGLEQTKTANELGFTANEQNLNDSVKSASLIRRLFPWFTSQNVSLLVNTNIETANTALKIFDDSSFKEAKNADFKVKNMGKFVVIEHKDGHGINSESIVKEVQNNIAQSLEPQQIELQISQITPDITTDDVKSMKDEIFGRISGKYGYKVEEKKTEISKTHTATLINLAKADDGSIAIVADQIAVKSYVKSLAKSLEKDPVNQIKSKYKSGRKSAITTIGQNGRKVTNRQELQEELISKIDANQPYTMVFAFEEIPFQKEVQKVDDTVIKATYTYDVAVWGSVSSGLSSFKSLAAETLASSKGWPAAGISFAQVASGGSFTLVLASPERVAAASSGCSAEYSCRVGRYVIINDQRWQLATPSWNSAGGSLRDYRHMVINHEVGHWLGFGHRNCPAAGRLAPVMQQQSISLLGCRFNPWPTQSELQSL